jgi:hypothetical protein
MGIVLHMGRDPWFPVAMMLIVLVAVWLGIAGPLPSDGWLGAIERHHGLASWVEAFGVVGALLITLLLWRADRRREFVAKLEAREAAIAAMTPAVHAAATALNVLQNVHAKSLAVGAVEEDGRKVATTVGSFGPRSTLR